MVLKVVIVVCLVGLAALLLVFGILAIVQGKKDRTGRGRKITSLGKFLLVCTAIVLVTALLVQLLYQETPRGRNTFNIEYTEPMVNEAQFDPRRPFRNWRADINRNKQVQPSNNRSGPMYDIPESDQSEIRARNKYERDIDALAQKLKQTQDENYNLRAKINQSNARSTIGRFSQDTFRNMPQQFGAVLPQRTNRR